MLSLFVPELHIKTFEPVLLYIRRFKPLELTKVYLAALGLKWPIFHLKAFFKSIFSPIRAYLAKQNSSLTYFFYSSFRFVVPTRCVRIFIFIVSCLKTAEKTSVFLEILINFIRVNRSTRFR